MLFRFREFRIYKEARIFRSRVYKTSADFPNNERFALVDQIRRAANSVLLNIAEGSNRNSDKEFTRFLNIALSSLEEVVACFDIALDEKYLEKNTHIALLGAAEDLGKQLISFMRTIKNS